MLALPGATSVHPAPHLSHPMASVVTPPRQLAPTVGRPEALAGVFIWTGSLLASGERMVCGLVHRFGTLNFISDNAGCFGDMPLPRNGCLINFGAYEVYVATEISCRFPEHVLVAADPPAVCAARGRRITRPVSCVEVMMTKANKTGAAKAGAGNTGTNNPAAASGAEVAAPDPGAHARSSKPPLEKGVAVEVEASLCRRHLDPRLTRH